MSVVMILIIGVAIIGGIYWLLLGLDHSEGGP